MTQREQFEKDYLEAFELYDNESQFYWMSNAAQYYDDHHQIAFEVWLQQAKRHEAEIAELVCLLKRYRTETPIGHQPHMICHVVDSVIAKYEVKK